jgi:hypothetical protein
MVDTLQVSNMEEIRLGHAIALWEFGVLLASTNYIPSSSLVLAHLFFCFFKWIKMQLEFHHYA